MRVFTYLSDSEDLPLSERAVARIKAPMPTGFGKSRAIRECWHPVIIYAATQGEAYAKAVAWWDAEIAKEKAKADAIEKRKATRAAKSVNPQAQVGDA